MPKFLADEDHADVVREAFAALEGLDHLRVRRRTDLLVIESGPKDDPVPHARFRRIAVHLWVLQVADHRGHWQPTGLRGRLEVLLGALTTSLGWTLARVV